MGNLFSFLENFCSYRVISAEYVHDELITEAFFTEVEESIKLVHEFLEENIDKLCLESVRQLRIKAEFFNHHVEVVIHCFLDVLGDLVIHAAR